MFYAHSGGADRSSWQPLAEHLIGVADRAEAFGRRIGLGKAARLAGLMHDLGKYTPAFQGRLAGSGERVDHSTAGARLVLDMAGIGWDRVVAELVSHAVAGHHAGLPDRIGASGTLEERLKRFDANVLDPIWRREILPAFTQLMPSFEFSAEKEIFAFQLGLLGRMIFSCLVDADFKDTEAHYATQENRPVDREWPALQAILPELTSSFDRRMAGLRNADSEINRIRSHLFEHIRAQATREAGLFTLTVPTGGGKTLASLGFALDHAARHGLDRIIYAIPFTSIIDQTAAIFCEVLGENHVLEHHSAIEDDHFIEREGKDKLRLAMEDWAAPVVVTSNVQLFESLFAARPSRCRKLHNIGHSVIILDEAQTLPRHLLAPTMRALDELARNYGCTIVLCTATQPALDRKNFGSKHPMGLDLRGRELAPEPERLARQFERVTIRRAGPLTNSDLVAALAGTRQGLVVVNSRKHALDLFNEARAMGLDGLFHLSTRQYAAHRRQILGIVRERLKNGQTCRVVSTSLIEAGVDVDFPLVWRAEAGLDQIAQAAGRCNREGLRPRKESIATVFSAPDYPPPPEIKALTGDVSRILGEHGEDLLSPAAIEAFFEEVYWRVGSGLDREKILDDFRTGRDGAYLTNFSYRAVAEKFRMIESNMVPVIVARDAKAIAAVNKLGIEGIPSGVLARELQAYTVQVPAKARGRLVASGNAAFAAEVLRGSQFLILQQPSLYSNESGLVWENFDYISPEELII